MPINWNPEKMSVNVKEIDEQHQHFIGILNKLYEEFYNLEQDQKKLADLLSELESYALIHFATEERYFDQLQYEHTSEHKEIHNEIKLKIRSLQEDLKTKGFGIIGDFLNFLEDWLVDHLEVQDRKYAQFFNDNGLF